MTSQSSSKYPQSRGSHIVQQLFKRGNDSPKDRSSSRTTDTYRQLKQLREMLKGGQITAEEYETIKFELLKR
jgi:hypothetical protein